jgi:pimeloyl-ACP methyl ester carboxylesterase
MPFVERDEQRIYYEIHGDGFPILCFAPGGMRSSLPYWQNMPWDPVQTLASEFAVIVVDQRNAGKSRAPVTAEDGWHSYAADHLTLLDELKIERCHLLGACIGGSFILRLLQAAPERFSSAVLAQPIGASDDNRKTFADLFDGWVEEVAGRFPDMGAGDWSAFGQRMFGGDFVYSVSRELVRRLQTPMLVLMGNDIYHPQAISRDIAGLAPQARLIEQWKAPEEAVRSAREQTVAFFREHRP